MAEKNVSKKEVLLMLKEIIETEEFNYTDRINGDVVLNFIDTSINQIEAKAKKAKEKSAEARAAGDKLREAIKSVLTYEAQTLDEITEAVSQIEGFEDATRNKVTARLTQLIENYEVFKTSTRKDGRRLMTYALTKDLDFVPED